MTNLSPAAQAVASAYDDTPEKDTGNHRYLWLAAALRALAYNVYSNEIVTCGGSSYALVIEQDDIVAIADELEAS